MMCRPLHTLKQSALALGAVLTLALLAAAVPEGVLAQGSLESRIDNKQEELDKIRWSAL